MPLAGTASPPSDRPRSAGCCDRPPWASRPAVRPVGPGRCARRTGSGCADSPPRGTSRPRRSPTGARHCPSSGGTPGSTARHRLLPPPSAAAATDRRRRRFRRSRNGDRPWSNSATATASASTSPDPSRPRPCGPGPGSCRRRRRRPASELRLPTAHGRPEPRPSSGQPDHRRWT
ncbi:hypothetical protein D3C81_1547720 [compost metagenome]